LIFGGLALVATLGVVNVWKKNKWFITPYHKYYPL
jgi:hypothetical protein